MESKAEGFERCGDSRRGRGERTVKFRYRVHLHTCVQKHKRKYRIFVLSSETKTLRSLLATVDTQKSRMKSLLKKSASARLLGIL